MKRINRIEPIQINTQDLKHALMITTTQLEIIRRVEITPIQQTVPDNVKFRSNVNRKHSRKISWCIGCLFITAGILALLIVTIGLIIILGKKNSMKKSNIERYDLGDLHYGVNTINHSSNIYLSNINKASIEKYLSDQLINIPGYRGIVFNEILIQDKFRKQRDTSCSMIFIIQNIQIYFDYCLTCINQRNYFLHNLFFNLTSFQQPFDLLFNNQHIFVKICSILNLYHLIIPINTNIQLISSTITSTLLPLTTIFDTNRETLISLTTDSSPTQETTSISMIIDIQPSTSTKIPSNYTTTSRIFQFLLFRPSIIRRNHSFPVIN